MSDLVRAHVLVVGRVQGVWFRDTTHDIALRLGVCGWIRNLADGRVEAVFEGQPTAVDEALHFVTLGPSRASVEDVQTVWEDPQDETEFRIR